MQARVEKALESLMSEPRSQQERTQAILTVIEGLQAELQYTPEIMGTITSQDQLAHHYLAWRSVQRRAFECMEAVGSELARENQALAVQLEAARLSVENMEGEAEVLCTMHRGLLEERETLLARETSCMEMRAEIARLQEIEARLKPESMQALATETDELRASLGDRRLYLEAKEYERQECREALCAVDRCVRELEAHNLGTMIEFEENLKRLEEILQQRWSIHGVSITLDRSQKGLQSLIAHYRQVLRAIDDVEKRLARLKAEIAESQGFVKIVHKVPDMAAADLKPDIITAYDYIVSALDKVDAVMNEVLPREKLIQDYRDSINRLIADSEMTAHN